MFDFKSYSKKGSSQSADRITVTPLSQTFFTVKAYSLSTIQSRPNKSLTRLKAKFPAKLLIGSQLPVIRV